MSATLTRITWGYKKDPYKFNTAICDYESGFELWSRLNKDENLEVKCYCLVTGRQVNPKKGLENFACSLGGI